MFGSKAAPGAVDLKFLIITAARSLRNFNSKAALELIPKFASESVPQGCANFGIGTLA